jgi:hypothetical protein
MRSEDSRVWCTRGQVRVWTLSRRRRLNIRARGDVRVTTAPPLEGEHPGKCRPGLGIGLPLQGCPNGSRLHGGNAKRHKSP